METCRKLQLKALRALAIGMPGVPDDFFEPYHDEADNQLRLLHCERDPLTEATEAYYLQTPQHREMCLTLEKRDESERTP